MRLKNHVSLWFFLAALLLGVSSYGCGSAGGSGSGLKLGVDVPDTEPVVKLETVMENPSQYDGKNIVMKGFVSGQCASLCEFFFKDGVHSATIWPQGFKFPKLELNRSVTVYTQVTSGEEQVVFSALGLEMG